MVVFLAVAAGSENLHVGELGMELGVGIAIGVVVPWAALMLERTRFFSASTAYEPLNAVAIGLFVLALGKATHGNLFLAAFAAGITVATFGERQRESFEHFGELIAEILKLAALITPALLGGIGWTGWVFAILALVAARPIAIWVSFLRSGLTGREQAAVMWFGPKGFASVVYGLLVLESGIAEAQQIFALVAVTIVASIMAHSSTDIVVARWLDDEHEVPAWFGKVRDRISRTNSEE